MARVAHLRWGARLARLKSESIVVPPADSYIASGAQHGAHAVLQSIPAAQAPREAINRNTTGGEQTTSLGTDEVNLDVALNANDGKECDPDGGSSLKKKVGKAKSGGGEFDVDNEGNDDSPVLARDI
jgi:hypothetical protein